ncbi:MAG: helix-turn-helix domain-containing protein [Bacillota bacterium]|nr:helix-turn-helix domain-containing protein [Bacillota bacterium]
MEEIKLEETKQVETKEEIKENAAYTFEEVMKVMGLGSTKTYEILRNKNLRSRKIGNKYLVLGKWILDFIEGKNEN